jgi:hypothetical protein
MMKPQMSSGHPCANTVKAESLFELTRFSFILIQDLHHLTSIFPWFPLYVNKLLSLSLSVIGADRQRSCVLLKRVPQGRTESGGIVLATNAGPRVPSGGVTLRRRCAYRPSVIYLIVNKLLSLSLSLSFARSLCLSPFFQRHLHSPCKQKNI